MNPREKLAALLVEAKGLAETLEKEGRPLNPKEAARFAEIKAEAEEAQRQVKAADEAQALLKELAAATDDDDLDLDDPSTRRGHKASTGGSRWAKSVIRRMSAAADGVGAKALLSGQVDTPPAVEIVDLPTVPMRLLDLVARKELSENTFSYLRQIVRTNAAAVVADGALKPTSIMTFKEIEDRARVIAHLSEPFPLRYLSDHESMAQVLDEQMVAGVIEELERQLVEGTGIGEEFTGIFSTTGVTDVGFVTDELTTIRRARTVLAAKGEQPTAWVLNPTDVEEHDLMREDGATGGFLMNSTALDTIFGPGIARVESLAVPVGTAILADWRQVRVRPRQGAHTLAATQGPELFDHNLVKLRSEGRFGIEIRRPQAVAVVHLTAA